MALLWSLSAAAPFPGLAAQLASAQAYVQCPNGQFVPPYQGCQQGYGCPSGGVALLGGQCTTVCPQQIVAPGQPCPGVAGSQQLYTCPGNPTPLPYGIPCPVVGNGQTYVCPGSTVAVPYGTPCPSACPAVPYATPIQNCSTGSFATMPPPAPSQGLIIPAPPSLTLTVAYATGWNIVAAPVGSTLPGLSGSLYTLQAGDPSYEVIPAGTALRAGIGYWAFSPGPITSTLAPTPPTSVTVPLPAQQWVMIGNPGNTIATVTGADVVLVTNTSNGTYMQATQLLPGQGGWAGSTRGGQVTITNAPS